MNIDNKALEKLSEKERKVALSILNEIKDKGESKTLTTLKYSDYKEIPVDIETFITDDRYLGKAWKDIRGNILLYPFWLEQLKKIFPNNLDTDYRALLESGARGIGKSQVGCGAIGAYQMYRVMCLKNPQDFYHLQQTEKIVFAFMNITKEASKKIAIDKFQKTIQMSDWFMSKGEMTQFENNPFWIPPKPIEIIIGSQSSDIVGMPVYFAFFDEINFIRNQDIDKQKEKALDMINTAIGGMKTRFIHDGKNPTLLVVASSKRSEQSFMETYIRDLSAIDGQNVYVVDKPVWEVKPQGTYSKETFKVGLGNKFLANTIIPDDADIEAYREKGYKVIDVPIDFRTEFLNDIDRGLCDFAGISTTSSSKYMSGEVVYDCIDVNCHNPFPDVLEIGNAKDDIRQYKQFFDMSKIPQNMLRQPLFIHLDMSISGDCTGIAGVWIAGKKPSTDASQQSKDLMFRLAFSTSIKAPKGRQISFEKNRNFIRWLRDVGFNIKEITSDTFQSYDLQQQLVAEGFKCSILSVDRVDTDHVCKPYQYLKNTVYEKRIVMYKSDRLYDEFVDVERNINTGKVDHTPNGHKDALDAVCGATFTASKYAEEFAYDYGESMEIMLDANNDVDEKQQVIVDFEEQLKNASRINSTNSVNDYDDEFIKDMYSLDDIIIL